MTRIERLKQEIAKLYEYRRSAIAQGNLYWAEINDAKIKEKEAELAHAMSYEKTTLNVALSDKGEEMKNKVYKLMLKMSLAADFLNDCAGEVEEAMKECDIVDFSFKKELTEIGRLSAKISSFVCIPSQKHLTDMMVYDDEFIATCNEAADKHLKETLNL